MSGTFDVVVYDRELILSVVPAISLCDSSGPNSVFSVWPEVVTLYSGGVAGTVMALDQAVYLLSEGTTLLRSEDNQEQNIPLSCTINLKLKA